MDSIRRSITYTDRLPSVLLPKPGRDLKEIWANTWLAGLSVTSVQVRQLTLLLCVLFYSDYSILTLLS